MYPPEEFTEERGEVRGSFTTYKRNARGGLDVTVTILEEDKHKALDLVDGGDVVNLITVHAMPRDEWDEDE